MSESTNTSGGPVAEEVELVRADDLAVVEIVRTAGADPVVRFSSEGKTVVWTVELAMAAAGAIVTVAEREVEEDPEGAERFMGSVLDVAGALIAAARLVRAEIGAAA